MPEKINKFNELRMMKPREEEQIYERCGYSIDDCKCVCPYSGKSFGCDCCIGSNAVIAARN